MASNLRGLRQFEPSGAARAVIEAWAGGDKAAAVRAVEEHQQADQVELLTDDYDWKSDNAELVNEVYQQMSRELPLSVEYATFEAMMSDYLLSLVYLPGSIDGAATALVTFWKRRVDGGAAGPGDFAKLQDFLRQLEAHPDGEQVAEIAAQAIDPSA